MTGFGEAKREIGAKSYQIEVRSLNGKNTDIRFKTSNNLKDKELAIRKLITDLGMRGKFDVNLSINSSALEDSQLNREVMNRYYNDLKGFASDNGLTEGDILQTLVRLPNVVQQGEAEITDADWVIIKEMTEEAMVMLSKFRKTEGASLLSDFETRVQGIQQALKDVEKYESARVESIKERIRKNINQHMQDETVDKNRFEQEILFYMEKLDINEEKVRLSQHCKFFLEELGKEQIQKGKKLNFISQEMGREINTLGAKAQHSDIQQLVVKMKDELEKIKEQVLNTL